YRAGCDRHRHHAAVRSDIKQLTAVAAPASIGPIAGRYLPAIPIRRHRLNPDFATARLCGVVREPAHVWRKRSGAFAVPRVQRRLSGTVTGRTDDADVP